MKPIPTDSTTTRTPTGRFAPFIVILFAALALLWPGRGTAQTSPPQSDTNTLCTWSFYNTNWSSDLGYSALSWSNVVVTDQGDSAAGYAPLIDAPVPAWICWNLIEPSSGSGTTNLTLNLGSIFLWFSPDWSGTNNGGAGPGDWGRLLEVGSADGTNGYFGFYIDPAGCNLLFASGDDQGHAQSYLTAPINWTSNNWHFLVLTYSSTNSAIYIDGSLATNGPGVAYLPDALAQSNGFFLGSAGDTPATASTNQARGVFDGLWTYNHMVGADTVAAQWGSSDSGYIINPNNLVDYTAPQFVSSAPSYMTNTPVFRAISGPGYLQYVGGAVNWSASTNVWMTNIVAKLPNGMTTISFSVGGGTNDGSLYDVFGTGALLGNNITNSTWSWLGQVLAGCRYSISNIPNTTAYLILGTPQDTDNDGLPDSYELLISHTDPTAADTAGSGLADWFWAVYFGGNTSLDPYSLCASSDGWTLLQAYQNGWDPTTFQTPPAPQGFAASYNPATGAVTLTWQPSPGTVTNYVLSVPNTSGNTILNLPPGTTSYTTTATVDTGPFSPIATYYLLAQYPGGSSPWVSTSLFNSSAAADGQIIRGPSGNYYVAVSAVPAGTTAIRVSRQNKLETPTSVDLPVGNLSNGLAPLPADWMAALGPEGWPVTDWTVQTVNASGLPSVPFSYPALAAGIPFFDGTAQLKQNLAFALRAADVAQYLCYQTPYGTYWTDDDSAPDSTYQSLKTYVTVFSNGYLPKYAFAGYYNLDGSAWAGLNEFLPFDQNNLYTTFVFATNNVDLSAQPPAIAGVSGWQWNTAGALYTVVLSSPLLHQFAPPTNQVPIPAVLPLGSSQFTCSSPAAFSSDTLDDLGLFLSGGTVQIAPNAANWFGLPFVSETLAYWQDGTASYATLNVGGTATADHLAAAFPDVAAPGLVTTGYYFGRPGIDPLPGEAAFSPTNTTPAVLIAGFGQPFSLAAYAKQTLTNGYHTNVFGYLGQYFTNAFKIETNGSATTQTTGLLSPYGEFFPTEPGPVALVTMPDPDTGQQGTGVVNVIKLQLDVNHDGNMDLTWGGPDNTSPSRPFVFWINNDLDFYYEHDVNDPHVHDYDFDAIGSTRNLEDFARLWIAGLPGLPSAQGFSISLSWRNTTGNPAIKLCRAVETDGGRQYLQNTSVALQQLSPPQFPGIGRQGFPGTMAEVAANSPLYSTFTFPPDFFITQTNNHFLLEGSGIGRGELVLTISQVTAQGTNVLAQTSTWFDLRDVKDMYEQVHIANVGDATPNTLTSTYVEDKMFPSDASEDKSLVLFVHGWRMGQWDYYNFSEHMFKRLYWQGFKGRFASARWPTLSKDDYYNLAGVLNDFYSLFTYNKSEFRAFQSGRGLSDYLTCLRARFPDYKIGVAAHSMGNIVMMQALKLQAAAGLQSIDNYVLMQAAVPAHCYDGTLPDYSPFLAAETNLFNMHTPDTYRVYPGSISDALRNQMVNFFNPNDFALATGTFLGQSVNWEGNQISYKPDQGFGYTSDGTNAYKSFALVSDPRQIMSFVARPRSKAVGALPAVNGVIHGGDLDLNAVFGFGIDKSEHSAEFNWNIHQLNGFYAEILADLLQ